MNDSIRVTSWETNALFVFVHFQLNISMHYAILIGRN